MATNLEAPLILAGVATGIIAGGSWGPLNFPLGDFAAATLFAGIGVIGRAFLDAKDARDRAIAAGAPAPSFDLLSLGYGLFSSPLIGGTSLALAHGAGFIPDFAAASLIMGMGYLGRDGMNTILDVIRGRMNRGVK